MSKRESFLRIHLIIKKLRKKPASFKEIADSLSFESELQDYNFNISKRTFQRDLNDIRSIYNIDIQFDHSQKVYYIYNDEQSKLNERIIEAFDTFNALNISYRLSPYLHFENRKPKGTEYLNELLHVIKNKQQIKFIYHKFWEDTYTNRTVEPYALKEFNNLWYLLAKDTNDNKIKSFALNRLTQLEITRKKINSTENFDVNKHYKYCFGIFSPDDNTEVQEIILSFNAFQGKFIKTQPIHETQEVLKDNNDELRIKLKLYITKDFLMKILSYGESVKVIKPNSLIDYVKNTYFNALNQYKNE